MLTLLPFNKKPYGVTKRSSAPQMQLSQHDGPWASKGSLTAKDGHRPVTIKVDLLPTITTTTTITREPKGQIHEVSLALSVEFKVTSGVTAQS
ncbi:hypothetical protein Tco_0321837 [Tanacetum coccineum]